MARPRPPPLAAEASDSRRPRRLTDFTHPDDAAPPLPTASWKRRRRRLLLVPASVAVAAALVWTAVHFDIGRLAPAVPALPVVTMIVVAQDRARLRMARRGAPGRWVHATGYSHERVERTGNLVFRRRQQLRRWYLHLRGLGRDEEWTPGGGLWVEVDFAWAHRCRTGRVVAVYRATDNRVVLVDREDELWPAGKVSEVPPEALDSPKR